MKKIPITKPCLDDQECHAVAQTLKSGWVTQGPKVEEFEKQVARFTGADFAVATTSCTTALTLSLVAMGIGEGDEVILPSFTFVATANAVESVGATPVFCDIDIESFNISPTALEKTADQRAGSGKLKAIIPVHLFGLSADMAPVMDIAKQYSLQTLEDAACAIGSFYNGQHCGMFGQAGCFSFHPRKAITTGEGGMVVTSDAELDILLRKLRDHGASKSDLIRHSETGGSMLPDFDMMGFNFRMTDIQGAVGVCQMQKVKQILEQRKAVADCYDRNLDVDWLIKPHEPEGYVHTYQSYVTRVNKKCFGGNVKTANLFRNKLMGALEEKGISVRQGTHAVHTLGYYKGKYRLRNDDFPASYEADRLSMTLPLYAGMPKDEMNYVIDSIHQVRQTLASHGA